MPSGGALASAVYAITDAIPFYDIGSVAQRFSNVCDELSGCAISDDEANDGSGVDAGVPSDGVEAAAGSPNAASGGGSLQSEVELIIGRSFGLPVAKSLMTTTCTVTELPPQAGGGGGACAIDVEIRVEKTAAKQSTLASMLPQLFSSLDSFEFPSGQALDALNPLSSRVRLRTTYLSPTLRISRPMLDLEGSGGDGKRAIFVYARE